ncbi:MAG: hypothetical protein IJ001_12630 [Oscillospiraceae bacterium]|nr:hypothetical protein [Oscillospiraceae bacterium]MBQ8835750.1 hypothetical protein [Oscillospiraceae bacterium]
MKAEVEIQPYDGSIHLTWTEGFEIICREDHGAVHIRANAEGLKSLASLCLTLAQETVPEYSHVHLDEFNSLEDGSVELIIEKG